MGVMFNRLPSGSSGRRTWKNEGPPLVTEVMGQGCPVESWMSSEVAILAVVNTRTGALPGSSDTRAVREASEGDTGSKARSR